MEPYAVHLLRRYEAGETIEQLAVNEGIPPERILMRLNAAFLYRAAGNARPGLLSLTHALLQPHGGCV
jgi:hypothetical protein